MNKSELCYNWLTAPSRQPPNEVRVVNQLSHALEPFVGLLALRGSTEVREKRILFLVSLFKCVGFAYRSKSKKYKDTWTAGIALLSWLCLRRFVSKNSLLVILAKLIVPVQLLSWGLEHVEGYVGTAIRTLYIGLTSVGFEAFERAVKRYKPGVALRDFPAKSEEVSKAWVERCLKECGALGEEASVGKVTVVPLSGVVKGDGDKEVPQGFVGETVRLEVEYSGKAEAVSAVPKTFVAKFSTTQVKMRVKMRFVNVSLREAQFYTAIAPRLEDWKQKHQVSAVSVPKPYGVGYDDRLALEAILMQDASPLKPGDETVGCTWEQACSVAVRYARFHSIFWSDSLGQLKASYPELKLYRPYDWMDLILVPNMLRSSFDKMLKDPELAVIVTPEDERFVKTVECHFLAFIKHLSSGPMTFIHADARMENMLWPKMGASGSEPRFQHRENRVAHSGLQFSNLYERENLNWLAVDWQTSSTGLGIYDLAYCVAMDLEVSENDLKNDACDRRLVKAYHDELLAHCPKAKAAEYTFEKCFRDYKLTMILSLMIPIVVMTSESLGEHGMERAKAVRKAMLRRVLRALRRVGADTAFYKYVDDNFAHRSMSSALEQVEPQVDAKSVRPHHEIMLFNLSPEQLKDINGYDRWFLNGYSKDGSVFIAVALGMYPARGVVDASFSVVIKGVQHNARASRKFKASDLPEGKLAAGFTVSVGPITLIVHEPLQRVEVKVSVSDEFHAQLTFNGRFAAHFEPEYSQMIKGAGRMEYERLTQLVEWNGYLRVQEHNLSVSSYYGTRDRSWGVRPHPKRSKGATMFINSRIGREVVNNYLPVSKCPQFYWFWTPINFERIGLLYVSQQDERGRETVGNTTLFGELEERSARQKAEDVVELDKTFKKSEQMDVARKVVASGHELVYHPKTRHAKQGVVHVVLGDGRRLRIEFECMYPFFMSGVGYGHPKWGHGMLHEDVDICSQYDRVHTFLADRTESLYWHVQEVSKFYAFYEGSDELVDTGVGVVEQLVIGPHLPSRFNGLYDV